MVQCLLAEFRSTTLASRWPSLCQSCWLVGWHARLPLPRPVRVVRCRGWVWCCCWVCGSGCGVLIRSRARCLQLASGSGRSLCSSLSQCCRCCSSLLLLVPLLSQVCRVLDGVSQWVGASVGFVLCPVHVNHARASMPRESASSPSCLPRSLRSYSSPCSCASRWVLSSPASGQVLLVWSCAVRSESSLSWSTASWLRGFLCFAVSLWLLGVDRHGLRYGAGLVEWCRSGPAVVR